MELSKDPTPASQAESLHEAQGGPRSETSSRPRGLLDLPDELIEHIFRDVRDDLDQSKSASAARGLRIPLEQAMVNKRIYALAAPFSWSTINATVSANKQSSFLARLAAATSIHSHITRLWLHLPSTAPVLALAALPSLPRLEYLSISLHPSTIYPDKLADISTSLSLLLSRTPRLNHLAVFDYGRLPPPQTGPLAVSGLRTLEGTAGRWIHSAIRANTVDLRTVILDGNYDFSSIPIEWNSLVALNLSGATSPHWMRGFTDSVRGSIHYPQSIALRHLTVSFLDRFEQAPPGWRSWFQWCFHAIRTLNVATVHITDFDALSWPQVNFEVPVTVLRICGNCKLYQDDTLKHFQSFLATFPAVRKLVIEHCSFSAAMETATAPDFVRPLDTATLAMRIPHLAAFVVFLETTSVLEFRYIGELDEYTVRWRRHSRSDPLVRDAVL